ncbi:hypothetical protein PAPYR_10939 [Paratrimastix pyriformis]|uniref:Uncharacterized protein n=1 Tax=Paratrimastix pyriformis TaxID=342808 RepID=A0ABQ8U4T1_9EUKA|nr:hypothetical protein PAPYR_10939 [Paratrimastix pyriformis]
MKNDAQKDKSTAGTDMTCQILFDKFLDVSAVLRACCASVHSFLVWLTPVFRIILPYLDDHGKATQLCHNKTKTGVKDNTPQQFLELLPIQNRKGGRQHPTPL